MNYEQRMTMTRSRLEIFMGTYSPPRRYSDEIAREAFDKMCGAIVRHMPALSEDGFGDRLGRVLDDVGDNHKTNAWPNQGEFVEAIIKAGKSHSQANPNDTEPPYIYDLVVKHYRETKSPLPRTAKEHHAIRMVSENIATYEELRIAGFQIPQRETDRICKRGRRREVSEVMEGFA